MPSRVSSKCSGRRNVFTTEVIHEAAQRIWRGRLRPFLESHGHSGWESLVGPVYEKSLSLRGKFDPALGTPVGYLAVAAAHQIFRTLSEEAGGLDIPRDRPGDSVDTRRWKEAARASISLATVEVGSPDDVVAADDDEGDNCPAGAPGASDDAEELPVADGNPRTRDPGAGEEDEEEDALPASKACGEVDIEGLANLVIALRHSGDPVLAALAAALQSPQWTQEYHARGAWVRAVGMAAKSLGKPAKQVRAHFLQYVREAALKNGLRPRLLARQLTEVDEVLGMAGKRGKYADKGKKKKQKAVACS